MKKINLMSMLAILLCSFSTFAEVEFYNKDRGVGRLEGVLAHHRFKVLNLKRESGWRNDEIRSLRLKSVTPGTRIYLFDDPQGLKNDDWVEIEVKKMGQDVIVPYLEQSVSTDYYQQKFNRKNGLSGKVSHIRIEPADARESFEERFHRNLMQYFSFNHKNGAASEFKQQNSNYRVWKPTVTAVDKAPVNVSFRMDHIRGMAKDDHANVQLGFDAYGYVNHITLAVQYSGQNAISSTISDVAQVFPKSGSPEQHANRVINRVVDQIAVKVARYSTSTGRSIFPSVIQQTSQKVAYTAQKTILNK